MRLDFIVKSECKSSIILSIGNQYSVSRLLCDTINNAYPQSSNICHMA